MVVFRADSSDKLGTGHVYRCVALANKFKALGETCLFLCSKSDNSSDFVITEAGHQLKHLPTFKSESEDADACREILIEMDDLSLVVVDHYSLGKNWEDTFYPMKKLLVIDDLQREHLCHFLYDNGTLSAGVNPYLAKCPSDCKFFLGPAYSLLREEFISARSLVSVTEKKDFSRVLVFFGGTDSTGESFRFLQETEKYKGKLHFSVLLSKQNAYLEKIRSLKLKPSFSLLIHPPKLPTVMLNYDVYLGSGGTITAERMFLGLPGCVISVASNQELSAKNLDQLGLQHYFGKREDIAYTNAVKKLEGICANWQDLNMIRQKNLNLVKDFSLEDIKSILDRSI
jgi:UDP-2,4-diacetamido-2,4,6-trideoxy-beta-L-altropyranose hydrolase